MTNNELVQMISKMISESADQYIVELTMKRLETGYADNQPRYPYWVKPVNYSYREYLDIDSWMREIFGDCDWSTLTGLWVGSDRKYWFRDERDRTMFILRWS